MAQEATYDTIGREYVRHRRPDLRIAAQIDAALGNAESVVNVGAGTGSYAVSYTHLTLPTILRV